MMFRILAPSIKLVFNLRSFCLVGANKQLLSVLKSSSISVVINYRAILILN